MHLARCGVKWRRVMIRPEWSWFGIEKRRDVVWRREAAGSVPACGGLMTSAALERCAVVCGGNENWRGMYCTEVREANRSVLDWCREANRIDVT